MFLIYIIRFNICNVYLKRFNFNKRQDTNHFPFAVCDLNKKTLSIESIKNLQKYN